MTSGSDSDLRAYLRNVRQTRATGQATEHSYRPALKTLIEALGGGGAQAINEPTHTAAGAPDFIVERDGVPIGHIECKDIGQNLDAAEASEQLQRYRRALPNLILTDYLEFRWYVAGELRETAGLGRLSGQNIVAESGGRASVRALLDAFFNAEAGPVGDAADLARRMAGKAQLLRDSIRRILDDKGNGDAGGLRDLMASYREVLISALKEEDFADLQAQTAAYGLFAARCIHEFAQNPDEDAPSEFTRQTAVFAQTTPFLSQVFGLIAGQEADPRISWIVDDLARLLDRADMGGILKDFGRRTRQEDPVVHFYEDFLSAYDPELRELRGVYYTPEPVVSYIVSSVDSLLRREFGLSNGLADKATVTIAKADGEAQTRPRVLILDPAVGTGTFLREAVSQIRDAVQRQRLGGAWPKYVREHLLPRLFGFELMMAPYAICHLKLALEIGGEQGQFTMPAGERLKVFLTNSLEEAHEAVSGPMFAGQIAHEARSADDVKRDQPVMVVIGNPPYSGHSANKGKWIRDLISDYKRDVPELKKPGQAKWLSDDYVKFIRFAQWRIERTGEGVLGFVTNHNYLDAPTFRGMRQSLLKAFDEIYLLDLHGNSKKQESAPDGGPDVNVFDIQQGVAIGLFVKQGDGGDKPARVFHADLWGEREDGAGGGKYGWLAANDVDSTEWTELSPKSPRYLFVPRDETLIDEYDAGWELTDILPVNSVGIVTARDKLAIQWTPGDMSRVAQDFADRSEDDARVHYNLRGDSEDWKVSWAQQDLRSHPDADAHVSPVLYRPFDTRWTYYTGATKGFICRPREDVMRHMLAGPNLGLISCRQQSQQGGWGHCGVSRRIIESCAISNKTREINYLFPLYVYSEESDEMALAIADRTPNLAPGFIAALASSVELNFTPDQPGDLDATFVPEDVAHYIYAVLHSPEYRRRYADFLKSDFPRVPLPGNRALFADLAGLGARLTALHLMDGDGADKPSFPAGGTNLVERVRYTNPVDGRPGRVAINKTQYFEGVSPETWGFTIGGYRPAEKWLKDRKGRTLSFDDIAWYQRVCAALAETPRVMERIDETIAAHGGWPIGVQPP